MKSVIIGFNGIANGKLLIPDNPRDLKNNVFITLSDSIGVLDIETVSTLNICRLIDSQSQKYTLSTSSLHLISCDTYYFGTGTF